MDTLLILVVVLLALLVLARLKDVVKGALACCVYVLVGLFTLMLMLFGFVIGGCYIAYLIGADCVKAVREGHARARARRAAP